MHTILEEALSQRITIREGDRTRSLTKLDGVFLTMVARRAQGRHQGTGFIDYDDAVTWHDRRSP